MLISFIPACKSNMEKCSIEKVIATTWTMEDYDKSNPKFKNKNEFKSYKISKDLSLIDIRELKNNYLRVWYQSPDPLYRWVVDMDLLKLDYNILSYLIDFEDGNDKKVN